MANPRDARHGPRDAVPGPGGAAARVRRPFRVGKSRSSAGVADGGTVGVARTRWPSVREALVAVWKKIHNMFAAVRFV